MGSEVPQRIAYPHFTVSPHNAIPQGGQGIERRQNCVLIITKSDALISYLQGNKETPGARGSVVVKALCYKPEGRWFDTR
jgi:hypothetical protein